jgi:hypothetical protein
MRAEQASKIDAAEALAKFRLRQKQHQAKN